MFSGSGRLRTRRRSQPTRAPETPGRADSASGAAYLGSPLLCSLISRVPGTRRRARNTRAGPRPSLRPAWPSPQWPCAESLPVPPARGLRAPSPFSRPGPSASARGGLALRAPMTPVRAQARRGGGRTGRPAKAAPSSYTGGTPCEAWDRNRASAPRARTSPLPPQRMCVPVSGLGAWALIKMMHLVVPVHPPPSRQRALRPGPLQRPAPPPPPHRDTRPGNELPAPASLQGPPPTHPPRTRHPLELRSLDLLSRDLSAPQPSQARLRGCTRRRDDATRRSLRQDVQGSGPRLKSGDGPSVGPAGRKKTFGTVFRRRTGPPSSGPSEAPPPPC